MKQMKSDIEREVVREREREREGCYFPALDFRGERNTLGWVRLG